MRSVLFRGKATPNQIIRQKQPDSDSMHVILFRSLSMTKTSPTHWTQTGFLDTFMQRDSKMQDRAFCFILGSGASVTSGIPSGGKLAQSWLEEIYRKTPHGDQTLEAWATAENLGIPDFDFNNPAASYGRIYRKRFEQDYGEGYAELEELMADIEPSFGYSVLAYVLAETNHKVVLTTNFDNLAADALSIYANVTPLICGHESLTAFASPRLRRPLIAKIHHDLFYAPKNTDQQIDELPEAWAETLKELLQHYTPIVLGYGGNDPDVIKFLESLPEKHIPGGVFWCYRKNNAPNKRIQQILIKQSGVLVEIDGFDEFMLQLHTRLEIPWQDKKIEQQGKERAQHYRDEVEELQAKLKKEAPRASKSGKEAIRAISNRSKQDWWSLQLEINAEENPDKKDALYLQAIKILPNSHELLGNYANFLDDVRKQYDKAEHYYKRAIEADLNASINLCNYATFLTDNCEQHDEAEDFYKRAIEADPKHAISLGNYANLLTDKCKRHEEAENLYKRAIEADPENANNLGNYALFLKNIRKQYDEAEDFYKRTIEADPDNASILSNYAIFLAYIRKQYDEAEALYKHAIAAEPQNANSLANYAFFLTYSRKQYDEAEELYKRAIEAEPENAKSLGNYAIFLDSIRKQYEEAEEFFKRAIEADPKDANSLSNYADFLSRIRNRYNEAEENYKRAIKISPINCNTIGNYTALLITQKRWTEAEEYSKQAWAHADPIMEQVAAEVAFYRALLIQRNSGNPNQWLGRLHGILSRGYERGIWSFDQVLEAVSDFLSEEQQPFYRALADAILDESAVETLDEFDQWRAIEPIEPGTEAFEQVD